MTVALVTVLISFAAGFHAASYGAYKDGWIKGFYLRKFFKSSLICRRSYVPGKFKSPVPLHPARSQKRGVFLVPYFLTWFIFLWLYFRPEMS